MKSVDEVTPGELARALKWRMDENRANQSPIERQRMEGPHEERVVASAIAALLGEGYSFAEVSTAYNQIVREWSAKQAKDVLTVGDTLTCTELRTCPECLAHEPATSFYLTQDQLGWTCGACGHVFPVKLATAP